MQFHHVINILIVGNLARGHVPVEQPTFKSSPVSIKSLENETIFLPCVVDNLAEGRSFIKWWKGNTLLFDSRIVNKFGPPKMEFSSDGMSIDSVASDDAGEYTCEVVRPKPWSSLKQTHKLQVLYPPEILLSPAEGYLEVVLGERVQMGCFARGVPSPAVSWRTEAFATPSIENNSQTLEFTATSRLMSGIYQCEADNGIGDPVHSNIFLRIEHKPEVTTEKSWVHSAPGIKTSLICKVFADPEAHVEWLFNGATVKLSPPRVTYHVRGDNHILQLNSVTVSDFGNYTCRAANRLGESQGFMQLSGAANPVVFKKVKGKAGEEFSLIWEVDSISPIFDYQLLFRKVGNSQWARFIVPADSSSSGPLHSKSYTFTGLDKLSAYEAKIFARNRFGWSNSSEIVTFGLMKSTYAEERNIKSSVFAAVESTNHALKLSADGISLIPTLWTIKFFLNICDTF